MPKPEPQLDSPLVKIIETVAHAKTSFIMAEGFGDEPARFNKEFQRLQGLIMTMRSFVALRDGGFEKLPSALRTEIFVCETGYTRLSRGYMKCDGCSKKCFPAVIARAPRVGLRDRAYCSAACQTKHTE